MVLNGKFSQPYSLQCTVYKRGLQAESSILCVSTSPNQVQWVLQQVAANVLWLTVCLFLSQVHINQAIWMCAQPVPSRYYWTSCFLGRRHEDGNADGFGAEFGKPVNEGKFMVRRDPEAAAAVLKDRDQLVSWAECAKSAGVVLHTNRCHPKLSKS